MFQANILKSSADAKGILDVTVQFTSPDTGEDYTQNFHGITDKENLDNLIQQQLAYYNGRSASSIQEGTWTPPPSPPPPPPPPPPTQQQLDQQAFQTAHRLVLANERALKYGYTTQDDYNAALADAQKKWQVAYLNLI